MSGNVWEWTRSPYQPYPYDEADDRRDLEADALWVIRGGHFGDPARLVRDHARAAPPSPARAGRSSASAWPCRRARRHTDRARRLPLKEIVELLRQC